jgi:hypothetical protein
MRLRLSLAAVACLTLTLSLPANAQPTASTVTDCGPLVLSGSVPMPPPGLGHVLEATIGEDCSVIWSEVRQIDAQEAVARAEEIRQGPGSETEPLGVPLASLSSSQEYHINTHVWDCCGIIMTQIVTDLYWTMNGTQIGSWNTGGYQSYHTENYCWPNQGGWRPISVWLAQHSGGNGQSSVTVRHHGEWSYRGFFSDCIDGIFYNVFDNYLTGSGFGGDCSFTYSFRQTAPGWHLVVECYYPVYRHFDRQW